MKIGDFVYWHEETYFSDKRWSKRPEIIKEKEMGQVISFDDTKCVVVRTPGNVIKVLDRSRTFTK